MDDVDVSSRMTRDLFEEKSKHILERVKLPLQQASHQLLTQPAAGSGWLPLLTLCMFLHSSANSEPRKQSSQLANLTSHPGGAHLLTIFWQRMVAALTLTG